MTDWALRVAVTTTAGARTGAGDSCAKPGDGVQIVYRQTAAYRCFSGFLAVPSRVIMCPFEAGPCSERVR